MVPICDVILVKGLIEGGKTHAIQYSRDVLEAVHPLLTLRSLSTNIDHDELVVLHCESSLDDTGGLDTRTKDVLIVGDKVGSGATSNIIQVAIM